MSDNENIQQFLDASFALAGYLLEAQDEEAAILATMRVSAELLGACGVAFVPLNEWAQSLPALKYGEAAFLDHPDWQAHLSAPATRHVCRICEKKQAGLECVLLQDSKNVQNVFCVALRSSGREIGMLSHFFASSPHIRDDQQLFLTEIVRLTDLTLSNLQMHEQTVQAIRNTFPAANLRKELVKLDAVNADFLEQLEYKAILDERTRLSREIHDGLAQTLAFLKMEAARVQKYILKGDFNTVSQTLQACYQTLSDAYLDARQAIDNLRQTPDKPFQDWLLAVADEFKTITGQQVDVVFHGVLPEISPMVNAQLIRIVQEALTNVRKHAQACSVVISAKQIENKILLEVRDEGRGFIPDDVDRVSHYGLRTMRERAESIGADFQIVSKPGQGTTICLHIPIEEKQAG